MGNRQKWVQWSVLSLLLFCLPLFIFLYFYRSLHTMQLPSLPIHGPVKIDTLRDNGTTSYDTLYHHIPDFQAINQYQDTIGNKELRGKVYIAHFVSSPCQQDCWSNFQQLKKIQDEYSDNPHLQIVTFLLSSSDSTNEKLTYQVHKYNILNNQWHLLEVISPSVDSLQRNGYLTENSHQLVLVDKKERIRNYYKASRQSDLEKLMSDIKLVLYSS